MFSLLREYIAEKLLGRILTEPDKISLIVLTNPKSYLPIRSITKSAKQKGMWQMQTFDENHNPFWDDQYDNLKNAILPLVQKGFRVQKVVRN